MDNICDKYLTDLEFLKHMIDHHQVAVDMSEQLKKVSNIPFMLELARNISYIQRYEIWIMKMMSTYGIPSISLDNNKFEKWNPNYKVGCYYPKMSKDSGAKCEMHFFKPNKKMLEHTNNINFLQHMIPHHQVAVNMSKRLLQHTKNPHMLEFANEIIKNQQYEIWNMKEALSKLKAIPPCKKKIPIQFHSNLF
jgi:uncharacterized protein (DUF305 family)